MIIEAGLALSAAVGMYYGLKHYGSAAVVAALTAEVSKIEGEVVSGALMPTVKADALALVARLKALL